LYALVAEGVPAGQGPERSLLDVAPTLLELLGEPVPADMEGGSMLWGGAEAAAATDSDSPHDPVTDTQAAAVPLRTRDLARRPCP